MNEKNNMMGIETSSSSLGAFSSVFTLSNDDDDNVVMVVVRMVVIDVCMVYIVTAINVKTLKVGGINS